MQADAFVYAKDLAKVFSDGFHLKNLICLQQQKYQTDFESLSLIVIYKCCILR